MFENEELIEIFPNQFTDNFETINLSQVALKNEKLKTTSVPLDILEKCICFKKFPELTIIIEQGINVIIVHVHIGVYFLYIVNVIKNIIVQKNVNSKIKYFTKMNANML